MYADLMNLTRIRVFPVVAWPDRPEFSDIGSMWLRWTAEQRRLWRKGHTYRGMFA